MNTFGRIGLWLGSLLLSVTLFSLLLSSIGSFSHTFDSVLLIFRVTMMFAFPVWCLYLPIVIALKDAEGQRIWTILLSGSLIGPVSVALLCIFSLLRGGDPHTIWQGDPLAGVGGFSGMVFALVVGFLTTCFYVIALKVLHRRCTAA